MGRGVSDADKKRGNCNRVERNSSHFKHAWELAKETNRKSELYTFLNWSQQLKSDRFTSHQESFTFTDTSGVGEIPRMKHPKLIPNISPPQKKIPVMSCYLSCEALWSFLSGQILGFRFRLACTFANWFGEMTPRECFKSRVTFPAIIRLSMPYLWQVSLSSLHWVYAVFYPPPQSYNPDSISQCNQTVQRTNVCVTGRE